MELSIIESNDTLTHVALSGRLDAVGVQQVGTRFQGVTASRGKPTIIDLSNVEFIASLGLGMLLSCARSLHGRGTDCAAFLVATILALWETAREVNGLSNDEIADLPVTDLAEFR